MRLKAKKPINLRGKELGGLRPLVCIPIVAEDKQELEESANKIVELCPDIIEWRADYFNDVCDPVRIKEGLELLRSIIKDIPIIFTFRSSLEGGYKEVDDNLRFEIIKQVICTEKIDVVDIELISGKTNIDEIKSVADQYNVHLILSFHNFSETPSVEFLLEKIRQQVASGASIAKVAVMPKTEEDVLNLLSATLKARREMPDIPIITMSMGNIGIVTRVAGCIFGSDLTFGAVGKTSAPGQIPIEELKSSIKALLC